MDSGETHDSGGLAASAFLPAPRWAVQFAAMATITKSPKSARKVVVRRKSAKAEPLVADWGIPAPIAPPPAKFTAADLLADVKMGAFLKGADLERIERAYKSRSSRRRAA